MLKHMSVSALALAAVACGQPVATATEAQAQPATTATTAAPAEVSAADKAAILAALHMRADARGMVMNECEEKVTPGYIPVDMGSGVGSAILFVMVGGPNMASCYGDGPDLHLMRREGGAFREIYSLRGGVMVVLNTEHSGGKDIADGGPGFSFPVEQWNGATYVRTRRTVSDAQTADALMLP
ncbi:MAG TPA: hypothetical protein VG841_01200 [Caulobacterales bacterium]|nr:hypothetical protein [Caulobacterales bacterium]